MAKYRLVPDTTGTYTLQWRVPVGHGEHAWRTIDNGLTKDEGYRAIASLSRPIIEIEEKTDE